MHIDSSEEIIGQTVNYDDKEELSVRIISETPLALEPIEIQRFTSEPIGKSFVVVPTRVPTTKSGTNVPSSLSLFFALISIIIMYLLPIHFIGSIIGLPFSAITLIFAVVGLFNPNKRILSITAFIISIFIPILWLLLNRYWLF
ncbi:MAG: hypothetical protein JXA54_16645 [Candidatus Heimdallarchaeota archaeon]|nr:hypothetical protein [Candidatus Heimdallarchaeota archaeon]